MEILVEYNGEYPCLCMGHLTITVNGIKYDFTDIRLISGGSCSFTDDYRKEYINKGPWEISEWPDDFPEEYKEDTLKAINNTIPWGCCGGCL